MEYEEGSGLPEYEEVSGLPEYEEVFRLPEPEKVKNKFPGFRKSGKLKISFRASGTENRF